MYYVTMTDVFMSNWGRAENLINKLIFLCDTYAEAQIVADNARARRDQIRVNICSRKPSYYRSTQGSDYRVGNYFVQNKTKQEYDSWYVKGYFASRR